MGSGLVRSGSVHASGGVQRSDTLLPPPVFDRPLPGVVESNDNVDDEIAAHVARIVEEEGETSSEDDYASSEGGGREGNESAAMDNYVKYVDRSASCAAATSHC